MRQHLFLLSLFVILSGTASAQKFGGGAFAGMSASQIDGDDLGGYNKPGINLGAFTYLPMGAHSRLQMELTFLQKGSREPASDTSFFYLARLNYIEVPLIYSYRLNDFSFEIGPGLDILASRHIENNGIEEAEDDSFRSFSLTAIAGISWHFSRKMYINFRTNNSITRVRVPDPDLTSHPSRLGTWGWRNVILSFALYYDFSGE